jgi:hypothetical protein
MSNKRFFIICGIVWGALVLTCVVKYRRASAFLRDEPSLLEIRDRQEIAKSFMINVEYYRKNFDEDDPSGIFYDYARRYKDNIRLTDVPSPLPTDSQITAKVGKIYYRKDSLCCVALLAIRSHYDRIPGLADKSPEGDDYDSFPLIGAREKKTDRFKIYVFGRTHYIFWSSYEKALIAMNSDLTQTWNTYTNLITGENCSWNVDDPEFFETAPEFRKYRDGYLFEYEKGDKRIIKMDYLSNRPDSIIRKYYPWAWRILYDHKL